MADRSKYPSEQADKYLLRLPDGMRERLKAAAANNTRTMNSEIVARLERTFAQDRSNAESERRHRMGDAPEDITPLNSGDIYWPAGGIELDKYEMVEAAIYQELTAATMAAARKLARSRAQPQITPELFYKQSLEQIEQMPEEQRAGPRRALDESMTKLFAAFGQIWAPLSSGSVAMPSDQSERKKPAPETGKPDKK